MQAAGLALFMIVPTRLQLTCMMLIRPLWLKKLFYRSWELQHVRPGSVSRTSDPVPSQCRLNAIAALQATKLTGLNCQPIAKLSGHICINYSV